MTYKEKDILAMFSELNSMFNELIRDYNNALDDIVKLKKDLAWYKDYADRLVAHKDMVCLPADLKNLRESNAALAIENQELKKQVETLKGVITQAWFTDAEEKDKQIEHLRQIVEKLSTAEPIEEELNSLFMDKQVNPKDIEFDGDKLVASVEEAASKLKSLNEHNDEYDFSTAKQNPHASKLKSLNEHNDNVWRNFNISRFSYSGIACPKCGSELYYNNPDMVLTSYPPKRSVECKNCKHTDYVY
jgi:DNA repair exonuclease SbcCD ATPase subunit